MRPEDSTLRYTVFIKVPFPRSNFEDPPDPNWDANKDRDLWKTLSSTARGKDIDWEALAQRFDVTIQFLLQQAAWLYEKQLSQVREQLRKVGKNSGISPMPGSASGTTATPTGGYSMKRGGSHGSRVTSSLSVRQRASLDFQGEASTPTTPVQGRVPYSRTTSKDTVTQVYPAAGVSATGESPRPQRASLESRMRETQILSRNKPDLVSSSAADSSSGSSSSSPDHLVSQSRAFTRRPNFGSPKSKSKAPLAMLSSGDEDDEDDSPAFLPYAEPKDRTGQRGDAKSRGKQAVRSEENDLPNPSTSSSQSLPSPAPQSSSIPSVSSPASNPVRPAAMAALSPRQRRLAQDGSEGSPSMGSSFSDLDEASLTQSALEEALAREMRAGKGSLGVVSRVGGLWKGQSQGQGSRRPG